MADLVPSFIKVYTTSLSANIRASSAAGPNVFTPLVVNKFVDQDGGSIPNGYVVLSVLSKGVSSDEDVLKQPFVLMGSTATKNVPPLTPLQIGVGVTGVVVEGSALSIPRYTRFGTSTIWK